MLREFLSKLFSPPRPFEEPRVQKDDFARLKQRIYESDEPQEGCELPHGRLTEFHSQHTPLKRSVSLEVSTSAYERYLQRNAARADNWATFEEVLHPKIETADLTAGSFIKPQEEEEEEERLASHSMTTRAQFIEPFLKPQPAANSNAIITARLISMIELAMVINAQKLLLTTASKSRIKVATLRNFAKKKHRHLNINLAQRLFKSWLCKYADLEITSEEALRTLSASSLTEVRKRVAANERIPYDCLWALANDREASVRMLIAKNPNCSIELLEALSKDTETTVASTSNKILSMIVEKK